MKTAVHWLKSLDFVVTTDWIESQNACADGAAWGIETVGGGLSLRDLLPRFERADWMLWTLQKANVLSKVQYVELAILCAESVIDLYEKKYPEDKRLRRAIKAAIAYVKEPSEKNRKAAAAAAAARKEHHKKMCALLLEKINEWDAGTEKK